MISLIICSRSSDISPKLKSNIAATIGIEFEIVLIENEHNRYSIFEAYNLGIGRCKYPVLCFMHDDILYHTQNWGQKVLDHFQDDQVAAIGIAGSPYAPRMPGSWWGGKLVNQYILPEEGNPKEPSITISNEPLTLKSEVVVLDGVWFCVRKKIFEKISFDEGLYKGYHFYDIDISLQIFSQGYKLFTVFDILISHDSKGNVNDNWFENALIYKKKWNAVLPCSCLIIPYGRRCDAELKTLNEYLKVLLTNNVPEKKVYQLALFQLLYFYKGYFYHKTPVYLLIFLGKYLKAAIGIK